MDNLEIILYIIFGAIWLIARLIKGKSKKGQEAEVEEYEQTAETSAPETRRQQRQPLNFEEILKQLGQLEEEEEAPPVREERRVERAVPEPTPQPTIKNPYAEYNQREFDERKKKIASDHSILSDETRGVRFEDYKLKKKTHPVAKILKSKDGIKNAIILNEILNRKY